MPTLFVWGADDPTFPEPRAREMVGQFPNVAGFHCDPEREALRLRGAAGRGGASRRRLRRPPRARLAAAAGHRLGGRHRSDGVGERCLELVAVERLALAERGRRGARDRRGGCAAARRRARGRGARRP